MKRYDSDEEGVMRESKDGVWNLHSDLSAHMLKLKEVVEGMSCASDCASRRPGYMVGGISFGVNEPPKAREVKHTCNCPRGQALRLIGEALK